MKNLTQYIAESLKPPRLSAKNKELWATKPLDEEEVMQWLKRNCNWLGNVDLSNGKINIRKSNKGSGSIALKDEFCLNAINFPYPFGVVEGSFYCNSCEKLKSLKGAPVEVGGSFEISRCDNLTTLEGAPKEVGGSFNCSACKNLKSLEYAPMTVGTWFKCDGCLNLTSLEGAPKKVGSNFYCDYCGKKFTKEDVKKVCKVKGQIHV